ncbi:MAG: hypothetical protein IPL33_12775 [Sphingobacteriales bacterium]|nr:hypothetical protein [Sphingobacteriales bacterium]
MVYALVNSAFGGLFKTTDGGASFTSLSLDISTTAILCSACKEHLGIEVSETNDNVLFMGSNQEIYKITVNPTAPIRWRLKRSIYDLRAATRIMCMPMSKILSG